jgi:hypothetical protein
LLVRETAANLKFLLQSQFAVGHALALEDISETESRWDVFALNEWWIAPPLQR